MSWLCSEEFGWRHVFGVAIVNIISVGILILCLMLTVPPVVTGLFVATTFICTIVMIINFIGACIQTNWSCCPIGEKKPLIIDPFDGPDLPDHASESEFV